MTQETAVEISDEVVDVGRKAADEFVCDPLPLEGMIRPRISHAQMRVALQAAIPLVVEGLVGLNKPIDIPSINNKSSAERAYDDGIIAGYNICRNEILAKVKK